MAREDGRANDQVRPVKITTGYMQYAEGSCLIEVGNTRVICTASVEERVPLFLKNSGTGWVTAEYGMLPRSCRTRNVREGLRGQLGGRTMEIQRLVGRALRSVVDLKSMGERTIWTDCDVVQADGGTRTASVTGAYVALVAAVDWLKKEQLVKKPVITDQLAAISVGVVSGEDLLDLDYSEDSAAAVDMNLAMTASGKIVEVQGTAEGMPFSRQKLGKLLDLAEKGIRELFEIQKSVLPGLI